MERNTLYRWIAQQLIERISSGNLKPGDRLPGEYQLAKDFHVGRSTIRDALRLLQESEHIVWEALWLRPGGPLRIRLRC